MTTAEQFSASILLISRASEAGFFTEADLDSREPTIILFESIKDNSRYPSKVCQYTTVEECLSFLDAHRAMKVLPKELTPCG